MPEDRRPLTFVLWLLVAAGVVTLSPLWLPMLLAAWFAHLAGPRVDWLERKLKRRWLAVAVIFALFLIVLVPVVLGVLSLIATGADLAKSFAANKEWQGALQSLVSDGSSDGPSFSLEPRKIVEMLREHGAVAVGFIGKVFGATATAVVQIFVFLLACHSFLSDGDGWWKWIVDHAPLPARILDRFRAAFHETGRGLVIGVGLTCLSQAIVATIAYTILDIPRALLLGSLTFVAAFIPTFGTAIIWVPVAAGLAISGRHVAAIVLAAIGVVVVGSIDNILNPLFARWGRLDLPAFVLILAIFGGFSMFGAWGFIVGPLLVRLAKEALVIAREER